VRNQSLDRGVTRRAVLKLAVGTSSALLLAACAGPSGPSPGVSSSATPSKADVVQSVGAASSASTASPKSGGALVIGMAGDLTRLDGHFSTPNGNSTIWQVYDVLVSYDDKLQPQSELAESWDVSADYKVTRLNLRKGVVWHSGRDFTSDDVKYNFRRLVDPKNLPNTVKLASQAAWWTVETPDKYTVILKSDSPRPGIFDFLTYVNILDKDTMEGPTSQTSAVGTGPFVFQEWVQGDHLAFTKNASYWRNGQPYLDSFRVQVLRDQQAMVTQLEAGTLDVVFSPSLLDAVRLKSDPNYRVVFNDQRGWFYYLVCNTTFQPLDNKTVRQALNFAVDRKRMADTVLKGTGAAQDLPWAAASPAFADGKMSAYTFDLDRAKNLLDSAGVNEFDLDLTYGTGDEYAGMAQIYQQDLAKIGVKAALKPADGAALSDAVNKLTYRGIYVSLGSQANLQEAATGIAGTRSLTFDSNSAGFKDPQYSRLFEMASIEPEPAKRTQIYAQLNDFILDQSFTMPIATAAVAAVTRANVQALNWDMIPRFTLRETWRS
jgi:peptide/nickel transport system substrate-binding protein